MNAKQYAIGGIIFIAFVGILIGLSRGGASSSAPSNDTSALVPQADAQVLEMTAKAGYKPTSFAAKADMPTTLRVKTNSTYDCSSSLNIPSLGVRKNLPATGTTDIAIPPQKAGTTVDVTCSMGMYHTKLSFN